MVGQMGIEEGLESRLTALRLSLEPLNKELDRQDKPFRFGIAKFEDMIPAPDNPRFMRKEVYQQLVENIKTDGGLSSLPFCWIDENGKIFILSGHHRTKAGHDAGEDTFIFLYTDRSMSTQEQISKRLSHNSLTGEDDPGKLKEVWSKINDLTLKRMSGIDDAYFKSYQPINLSSFTDQSLAMMTIDLMFMPKEVEDLKKRLKEIQKGTKLHLIGAKDQFSDIAKAIIILKESSRIINTSTALQAMITVTSLYCDFLEKYDKMPECKHEWEEIQGQMQELGFGVTHEN